MILPLLGFFGGVLISGILGLIVFAVHPKWKISLLNIMLFIPGSFAAALLSAILFSLIFGSTLTSIVLVIVFFCVMAMAVVFGGYASTYVGRRLLNKD